MKKKLKLLAFLTGLLYPSNFKCVFCGKELDKKDKVSTCEDCLKNLPYVDKAEKLCEKCGDSITGMGKYCYSCKHNKRHFDKAYAPFVYTDQIKQAVHNFKFNNAKYLFYPMASFMSKVYFEKVEYIDVIVPVPMFKSSLKRRGYNQAVLLSENLAEIINVNVDKDSLIKNVKTLKQVGLEFDKRQANVKDSFSVVDKNNVKDKVVLLIDDVLTSGATVSECSKVLKQAGAKKVIVLTLARTHFIKS